jgi:hypothetical protein
MRVPPLRCLFLAIVFSGLFVGCDGSTGPAGAPGTAGPPGQPAPKFGTLAGKVVDADRGAAIAMASVTLSPIARTASATADGMFTLDQLPVGVYAVDVLATGYASSSASVSVVAGETTTIQIRLSRVLGKGKVIGVVKRYTFANDPLANVAAGTVSLVDAQVLASSASRAPLETLAAASPYVATTDATGAYSISDIADGQYYLHVTPAVAAAGDLLPGGDTSRTSFEVKAGQVITRNPRLSQKPSATATYLGSSTCLICHGPSGPAKDVAGWKHTLHALVYRVPDAPTTIQDLSRLPNHDLAMRLFKDGNPRDNTGASDGLGLRISTSQFPKFPTTYSLLLGYDGRYFMRFESTTGVVSGKYYVDFTFGGHGLFKQRWVTRVSTDGTYDPTPGGTSSYYILPVQYDEKLQAGAV